MNELLPYVKEELGPIVQTPPIPVWQEHIDKFLQLTKEYGCNSAEDFQQAKTWAEMGLRLKEEMFESFKPYFDFLDKLRNPIIDRRNHDVNKINERMNLIDSSAIDWKREQDRILELEQTKRDAEELQRRILEREEQLEIELLKREMAEELRIRKETYEGLLRDWSDKKQIAEDFEMPLEGIVEPPPVVPPRHSAVESQFTYRKGKRTKPKLIAKIVAPEQVKREYCQPDRVLINLKVANWAKQVIKPTDEQIVALAAEIGGVVIGIE